MVAGRVGGQVNAVNAGQGLFPFFFQHLGSTSDHVLRSFFRFWISLFLQLDSFCQSGHLSADCRHCCSLEQLQEGPSRVLIGSSLIGP